MSKATDIRRQLKPFLDFDFWVRDFKNGNVWVAPSYGSAKRMESIVDALRFLGYDPKTNGTPGTSGAHIVDLFFRERK